MKHTLRAAALAVGALLCFSATEAFAGGITFLGTQPGGSWFAGYQIDTSTFGPASSFNRVEITIVNNQAMTFNTPSGQITFATVGTAATVAVFNTQATSGDVGAGIPYRFADNTPTSFLDFGGPTGTSWHENPRPAIGTSSTFAVATGTTTSILNFWLHLDNLAQNGSGNNTDGVRYLVQLYRDSALVAVGQGYFKQQSTFSDAFQELQIVPLPPAIWAGLATLGAMGAFIAQRRRSRQLLV